MPADRIAVLGGSGAHLVVAAGDPTGRALRVAAIEDDVVGRHRQRCVEVAGREGREEAHDRSAFRSLATLGSIFNATGAPRPSGLRGRQRAADRLNLIRVMPAQGDARSARPGEGAPVATTHREQRSTTRSSSARGVIGLACAWRAAQRGLDVLVLERDRPGAGASERRRRDARAGRRGDLGRGPAARAGARLAPRSGRSSPPSSREAAGQRRRLARARRPARRARPRRGRRAAPPLRADASSTASTPNGSRHRPAASSSPGSAPAATAASTPRTSRRSIRGLLIAALAAAFEAAGGTDRDRRGRARR